MTEPPVYVYRGTTAGWLGNACMQREERTCATTDPFIATVFAVQARNYGTAVVQFLEVAGGVVLESGNAFDEIESEVVVPMSPADFTAAARAAVDVDVAIGVLRELGFEIPSRLPSGQRLTHFLEMTFRRGERLSLEQRRLFDARALEETR